MLNEFNVDLFSQKSVGMAKSIRDTFKDEKDES